MEIETRSKTHFFLSTNIQTDSFIGPIELSVPLNIITLPSPGSRGLGPKIENKICWVWVCR